MKDTGGTSFGDADTVAQPGPMPPRALEEKIGDFVVTEKIGQGGMGSVFKASDPSSGCEVAVKLVNTLTDETALRRFQREARLLRLVKSDYVAGFIDSGLHGEQPFLVMDFVAGDSLSDRLDKGPLDEEEALRIAGDMARGLAEVHAAGIVHRDIKPSNVILHKWGSQEGRAILCDFGIARREGSETDAVTREGGFVGTPAYVAPEILTGMAVDGRADVYSLGTVVYAMLAGAPPLLRGTFIATVAARLQEEVPKLRTVRADVSDGVAELVDICLARAREERPHDARDFLERIEELRRGAQVHLSQHPVLPGEIKQPAARTYEVELLLKASPEELWPLISDTNRVNKLIGLDRVEEVQQTDDPLVVIGRSRPWWGAMEWEEHPYEWVAPKRLGVVRVFSKGPLKWYRSTVELTPKENGTLLRQKIELVPKGRLGAMVVGFEMRKHTRLLKKMYRDLDGHSRGRSEIKGNPFQYNGLGSVEIARLGGGAQRLLSLGCEPAVVTRLVEFLQHANAQDVARIRPKAWARSHGFHEDKVLETFLRATEIGLLVHRWHLICSRCRVPASMAEVLAEVASKEHCDSCRLGYHVDFARSVELIFQAHEQIRQPDSEVYCIGGPGNKPHVVAQVFVDAGQRFQMDTSLSPGSYQFVAEGLDEPLRFRVADDGVAVRMEVVLGRGSRLLQDRLLAPDSQQLVVTNETETALLARIEIDEEDEDVFSAAEAACVPLFRSLFAEDVLSAESLVRTSSATVLLVDDSGSSNFAALRGVVEPILDSLDGAIVKIWGKGIMATFRSPVLAVDAATQLVGKKPSCRIAVDLGAAMVTTVNRRLDYFGEVVESAEVIHDGLKSGDVGIGEKLAGSEGVKDFLANNDLSVRAGLLVGYRDGASVESS